MRAAVCYEFGKPLVIEDLEIDPPQAGEVLVRMAATAICHSDIHALRGDWGGDVPSVYGHEAAGVVEALGPGVAGVRPGDPVVVSLLRNCGHCFYCMIGSPHLCEGAEAFPLATQIRLHARGGQPVRQGINCGAFAEYAVVHESQLVPVDREMPLDRACLLACGVITGVGAAVNTARIRPGSSVVVLGTGGVGLNAVQGAVLAGAHTIIAMDLLDAKLEAARAFGATHAINAGRADAAELVRGLTGGRGADYVLVTVGSVGAVIQALGLTRKAGTVVLVGIPPSAATITVPVSALREDERRVIGCAMGSTPLSVDVPWLVGLYRQGRLKLDELITARYPLEQINEAIEAVERGEALRNVIVFD
jgi:S-(hydroxymethyl)glutathione dehydrogenase / alcohol dehydrogenase